MAKVKTLVESLREGYETAFGNLDQKVENLGDISVTDVRDIVWPANRGLERSETSYIERIVVYEVKKSDKRLEGEPWRPALDMDLMEFAKVAGVPSGVESLLDYAYAEGKKTIREFIAMPSDWFKKLYGDNRTRKALKKEFNKYGFKLYKRGNVIKD